MSKTLEYDCSMCGVHLIAAGDTIPEPKVCWSCKEKYGFFQKMIEDYLKKHLRVHVYSEDSSHVRVELKLDGEILDADCTRIL